MMGFDTPNSRQGRPEPCLRVRDIEAGYGTPVLRGLSLEVGLGEIATVVGANGCGKSTLLKTVMGLLRVTRGTIEFYGQEISNLAPEVIVEAGVGYVPQDQEVFPGLSVRENLQVGAYGLSKGARRTALDRVVSVMPRLTELWDRPAGRLSGGERKLVSIGRALMRSPRLLVFDEPTAGVAPALSEVLLKRDVAAIAKAGTAVLLVEQKAKLALSMSDWGYMLVAGRVRMSCPASELAQMDNLGELFLGLDGAVSAGIDT